MELFYSSTLYSGINRLFKKQKGTNFIAKAITILAIITMIVASGIIQSFAGNTRHNIDIKKQSFNSHEGKELISQIEQDLKNFAQNPKDVKNFNLLTQKAIEKCTTTQMDTKDKPKVNKCIIKKIYYDFSDLSK